MAARDYAGDVARAIAFLSRIAVPKSFFEADDGNLGRVSRAFPLAGALIVLPAAIGFGVLLALGADPLMAAMLALAVQTATTGALHEDGLCDTADGLGGGNDTERALQIMKDSRIGTYGAIALILSLGLRAAALAAIARGFAPALAALSLPAVAALSRGAMVWHWFTLPPAKPGGVAASAGRPARDDMQTAVATAVLIAALLLAVALRLPALLLAVAVTGAAAFFFTGWIGRRLTGHTGDTIGATQQICETAAFCALAMCA